MVGVAAVQPLEGVLFPEPRGGMTVVLTSRVVGLGLILERELQRAEASRVPRLPGR